MITNYPSKIPNLGLAVDSSGKWRTWRRIGNNIFYSRSVFCTFREADRALNQLIDDHNRTLLTEQK